MDKYRTLLNGQWTELDDVQLQPGYHVPEGVNTDAAWGARMITQGAFLDFVGDRQSLAYRSEEARDELTSALDGWVIKQMREVYKRKFERYEVSPNYEHEFVIYEGKRIKALANTNGSHGYLYISAWLKDN